MAASEPEPAMLGQCVRVLLLLLLSAGAAAAACNDVPLARDVRAADNGGLIVAEGNAQFPICFAPAAEYAANFSVELLNADAGRAKDVVLGDGREFKLWPLQIAKVRLVGGRWYETHPPRWKHPGGSFDLFTDYARGSDKSDCLSEQEPCRTLSHALYQLCDEFEFNGTANHQSHAIVKLAEGTTDRDGLHWACRVTGGQGGMPLTITSAGKRLASICPEQASAIGAFTGGVVLHLENIRLCSGGGNAVENALGGRVYVGEGVVFGPTPHGEAMHGDDIRIIGRYRIEP